MISKGCFKVLADIVFSLYRSIWQRHSRYYKQKQQWKLLSQVRSTVWD